MRADPDVLEHVISDDDEYLLMGTDGVWNEL